MYILQIYYLFVIIARIYTIIARVPPGHADKTWFSRHRIRRTPFSGILWQHIAREGPFSGHRITLTAPTRILWPKDKKFWPSALLHLSLEQYISAAGKDVAEGFVAFDCLTKGMYWYGKLPRLPLIPWRGHVPLGSGFHFCLQLFRRRGTGVWIRSAVRRIFIHTHASWHQKQQSTLSDVSFQECIFQIFQHEVSQERTTWRKRILPYRTPWHQTQYGCFQLYFEAGPAPWTDGHPIRLQALLHQLHVPARYR